MSSAAHNPHISYIPARKWRDLAEEVLDNPDAYYEAAQAQLEKKIENRSRGGWIATFWGKKSS
jgi:hypothetical protein